MKHPTPKTAKAAPAQGGHETLPPSDPVALSRTGTDLDKLNAALSEARGRIEMATRAREAAEASYREQILDASPDDLATMQAAKASATIEVDRAEALVAALTKRISIVRDGRDRDERKARHANAAAKCDAVRSRLSSAYQTHALAIRHLLADLADAEASRDRARSLMDEFGTIEPVEDALRRLGGAREEIVDREEVMLWAIEDRAEPLPAEQQDQVRARPGKPNEGYLTRPHTGGVVLGSQPFPCVRRRFVRTRFRERIAPPLVAGSLLNSVNLPAFDAYAEDFVTAERLRGADTAFDHLSRELPAPGEYVRPVLERFEWVSEPPRGSDVPPMRIVA